MWWKMSEGRITSVNGGEMNICLYCMGNPCTNHWLIVLLLFGCLWWVEVSRLEESELLLGGTKDLVLLNLENVETNSLRQRSALARSHNISLLNVEARRSMHSRVLVALLETVVLLNVVQVMATNNNSSGHLGGHNHTSEDSTSNGNIAGEGALLVDISTVYGFLWCGETKANVLPPTCGLLGSNANWGGILSLESLLVLISHTNLNY